MPIPRTLYTYWHSPDDAPPLVAACLASIRRCERDGWTVRTLRAGEPGLPPPPASAGPLSAALLSDWYRLAALAASGGVYYDATCIALQPPDCWVDLGSDSLQGFRYPPDGETMESWAIAAPPNHRLVARWRDELREALETGPGPYCDACRSRGLLTPALEPALPYLLIHACWRAARAAHAEAPLALHSAVEPGAPFHHLRGVGSEPLAAISALFAASEEELEGTPLIKLRRCDRECVPPLESLGAGSWLARQLKPELSVSSRMEWLLSK